MNARAVYFPPFAKARRMGHPSGWGWLRFEGVGHPPTGGGTHMLPVKAEIRGVIGKDVGETVKVLLEERIVAPR